MKPWSLVVLIACGCVSGGEPPTTVVDAAVETTAFDTARFDGPTDAIFPVEDSGPTGICAIPSGTTVTVSGSYMSTPGSLIDTQLSTVWNSGDYTGWLKLQFPKSTRFDRVRIAANSLPDTNETFTFKSGGATVSSATRAVTTENKWLPVFEVPLAGYDELLIEVSMSASWIALAEVAVFDSAGGCPAP